MSVPVPDRRTRPRHRTLMGGTVRFASHTGTMSCLVRNLASGGARLEMDHTLWLPDRFDVDIPHQNLRAPAKVIWREKSALGIAFDEPTAVFAQDEAVAERSGSQATIPTRAQLERIMVLEKERAQLQARIRQLTDEF